MPAAQSNAKATHLSGLVVPPKVISDTTYTLEDKDAGKPIILSIAATQTITLPAATGSGRVYTIICGITATGNKVIACAGSDKCAGTVHISTDTSGLPFIAGGDVISVTMNGGTTGGLIGSTITFIDVASALWSINGNFLSTGVEATPYAT